MSIDETNDGTKYYESPGSIVEAYYNGKLKDNYPMLCEAIALISENGKQMTRRQWLVLQHALLYYREGLAAHDAQMGFDPEYGPDPTTEEVDELVKALDQELIGKVTK